MIYKNWVTKRKVTHFKSWLKCTSESVCLYVILMCKTVYLLHSISFFPFCFVFFSPFYKMLKYYYMNVIKLLFLCKRCIKFYSTFMVAWFILVWKGWGTTLEVFCLTVLMAVAVSFSQNINFMTSLSFTMLEQCIGA